MPDEITDNQEDQVNDPIEDSKDAENKEDQRDDKQGDDGEDEGGGNGAMTLEQALELRDELQAELDQARAKVAEAEAKDARIAELEADAARLADIELSLVDSIKKAADKYREAVARLNPAIPAEMLQGNTVEEVEASLETAGKLVQRVKESLNGKAASGIPGGAPAREGVDTEGLSPREKINYGVRKKSQGK